MSGCNISLLTQVISYTNGMLPIPAIASLRALESVIRLGRFASAAEELGITQSAVSQHVKSVEQWVGQKLVVRGARGSQPTPAGEELSAAFVEGTRVIGTTCEKLRRHSENMDTPLTITTLPGFAVKWLFPRLHEFDSQYPEVSVSISTDLRPVDFGQGQADCAIRYGVGNYPRMHTDRLFGEHLYPVAAPKLLEKLSCDTPADLSRHTLLVDEIQSMAGLRPSWQLWLQQANVSSQVLHRTRRFSQSNMVVQAALEGMGIALGRDPLVRDEIAVGNLVRLFDVRVLSPFAYHFVCPPENLSVARVASFRQWLLDESAGCDYG